MSFFANMKGYYLVPYGKSSTDLSTSLPILSNSLITTQAQKVNSLSYNRNSAQN